MKILFTGGGTGGHIFPLIAVVREIRKFSPKKKLDFYYIGPEDEFSKLLLSQEDIKVKQISAGKIRRYFTFKSFFQNIYDLFVKNPVGLIESFFYIFFLAPDLIFSKGGFGSIPSSIAGWILRVPIFLHEADAAPGLANRFLSRISVELFVSFRRTPFSLERRMLLTGNPIRRELLTGSREEAIKFFHITGEKPVVLVMGGSQGAQRINDKILDILPNLLKEFELIHQTGEKNWEQVREGAKVMINKDLEKYYHPFGFLKEEELKKAYAICDFVVSRAGSGSIFEIAALGRPSILVPLPESAQGHQLKNAYSYAADGASLVLEEENFTPHFFLEKLKYLFYNPEELEKMRKAAKEFSKPLAAKVIAAYLLTYLGLR